MPSMLSDFCTLVQIKALFDNSGGQRANFSDCFQLAISCRGLYIFNITVIQIDGLFQDNLLISP